MHSAILPAAGTKISAPTHLVYRHYGIVTERGMVISNSARRGGIAEETLEAFCNGKDWRIEPRPSALPWWQVLTRARQHIGRPYKLFGWNCESFVNDCFGLAPRSDQVAVTLLAAFIGAIAVAGLSGE
jgi:hypothetical protein